jgi:NAD(P)-dependent dehydrogenase (short-subunit alcohol dehydrogenase family)
METALDDTVAIVTGAARGLGKAVSTALAAAGARVALVDLLGSEVRAAAEELSQQGGRVLPVETDITCLEQVEDMARQVGRALGPVDLLVNNAGTFSVIAPVWEADPEKWFRDIRVNLYGSFLCCRTIVRGMVERCRGRVINVASSGGVSGPHPYSTSYAASKTALVRLTEGLAQEAEQHGVSVFAIGPPAIRTAMTDFIATDPGGRRWRPSFADSRWHSPDCVTRVVLALAGGRYDRLTGRYLLLPVDLDVVLAEADRILAEDLLTLRIRPME